MPFTVLMALFSLITPAHALDVSFLTQQGPLNLKTWTDADLKKLSKKNGEISAQKLIFDESTQTLDLNDRADVDLITLYGEDRMARVPRFMVWRGFLKFNLSKDGSLNSRGDSNRLLVPSSLF